MRRLWIPMAALALLGPVGRAETPGTLSVARLFANAAVLQRDVPVPVWGTSEPGARVVVEVAGLTRSASADAAGRWAVELPPLAAGGPWRMTVESGEDRLVVDDLLVGDVWVCSGQSNMEWVVADSLDAAAEIAAAGDRSIRHLKVPRSWSRRPEAELAGGVWEIAGPERVGGFTAVGYFFARELRRHHEVPIGLINATWGGSRIEAWMSAGSLDLDAAGVERVFAEEREWARLVREEIRARAGGLPERDRGLIDGRAVWAAPDLDDSGWHEAQVPGRWEEDGWPGLDGVVWYRAGFELSGSEAAAGIRLGLAMIDDSDTTWVNGHQVGRTENAWNRARVYEVPAGVLRAGRNVVAVRVEDGGGGGGIHGDPGLLYVEAGGVRQPLVDGWRLQLGEVRVSLEDHKREVAMVLYNRMIHPLLRFPVRGVLWYQGESNAWPGDAFVYRRHFRRLIEDWRAGWAAPELPFLFVQLANFMAPVEEPAASDWALLRESQAAALALSRTAQVVAIDAGEAEDVHPRDKQVIGHRLALAARALVYGEETPFSGPVYRRHEIDGDRVVVEFDHLAGGLVARSSAGGRLEEFAVAGEDRRFVRAEAVIDGDRVVVWSDAVGAPVALRYAWADNPDRANLYNRAGLPASPFRTDDWPAGGVAADPRSEETESEAGANTTEAAEGGPSPLLD